MLGDVLGPALGVAVLDRARQRDLAVLDRDLDARGVDPGIVHQVVADQFPDTLVRAHIALGADAAIAPLAVPRRGLAPRVLLASLLAGDALVAFSIGMFARH